MKLSKQVEVLEVKHSALVTIVQTAATVARRSADGDTTDPAHALRVLADTLDEALSEKSEDS